jgi:N-methylhydantoinase A/oxoprolinase/acetone carboxylase beta subunit
MTNDPNGHDGPNLVLGIDTGGTYTDAVLLEYESRRVLSTCKSLTTRRDLALGIEQVIDGIRIEDATAVKMVSISTTLATNAIAESQGGGRGPVGRVALLLIGYDPDLITSFKMEHRFATPHYYYFRGGHDLYGQEKETLDLSGILARAQEIKDQVDAIAVSAYFSPLNPEHENRVYQALGEITALPVVLGHQLSTKLGSVERATTAALNASLLGVLQTFVVAVRRALQRRRIDAPLMVVRGDGTLMSDAFAARSPVETIHSGPAASAIGGRFLSRLDDALVVDVGGTTTDIALIQAGQVAVNEEGATVGNYKTAVKAANLMSIALGGDSHITVARDNSLLVGPERVAPLAYLAWQYPQVQARFKSLSRRNWSQATPEWLQYWYLLRDPDGGNGDSAGHSAQAGAHEKALVDFLRDGPQPLPAILEHLQLLHVSQLGVTHLLRREIIGRAGLTPTDLLHVDGRYTPWDAETATHALDIFCRHHFWQPAEVCRRIWSQMSEKMVQTIVTFLSGKTLPPPAPLKDDDFGRWFFHNSLYPEHPQLASQIRLRLPLIGIGAPAAIFLPAVAAALHTELVLPEHHQVANAVGAVAGSVMAVEESLVYPRLSGEGLDVIGYYVQAGNGRDEFETLRDALNHARALSRQRALEAAIDAGADQPQVLVEEQSDGLDTYRIRARAAGNPRLSRKTIKS